MLAIQNTLISDDLVHEHFACDLSRCKGGCCVAGDSGAPLEDDEIKTLEAILGRVKPFMSERGRRTVEEKGVSVIDQEGEHTTPLNDTAGDPQKRMCAFAVMDKGIARCSIENAHAAGKVNFRKPVSCHLYPVRIKKYDGYDAVNVHQWHVCAGACELGKKLRVPVFEYVKDGLIRKYGEQWFSELRIAANLLRERVSSSGQG